MDKRTTNIIKTKINMMMIITMSATIINYTKEDDDELFLTD